ncbi:MAG: histidine kinase [Rhodobacteraceae bacterium]|nr:histidine kinase [Paracoccaceae bacterium]
MNGKVFATGFFVFAAIFGGYLYYSQVYAYYEEVTGVTEIMVQDRSIAVGSYEGIDATSSGLKLRGCFTVDLADFEGLAVSDKATPLSAPSWFDCFDIAAIHEDIKAGQVVAYRAAENEKDGIDRFVAVYPDGRAYQWRQLNVLYQE